MMATQEKATKRKRGNVIYEDGDAIYSTAICPFCGFVFEELDNAWEEPYCPHCGAELLW